ncbi:MAG: hypothetical protein DWQ01_16600 [Planctomycetota bacterium]|nr:MAG: hypothetical protein DWQ01_16600 [Planctomycetota bacterium]
MAPADIRGDRATGGRYSQNPLQTTLSHANRFLTRIFCLSLLFASWNGLAGQSLPSNPGPGNGDHPWEATLGWWHTRLEDRSARNVSTAISGGPVLHLRRDLGSYWSAGIQHVSMGGDIEGTITDPFVEYWFVPHDRPAPIYGAAFLGYHWGDFEYVGPDRHFTFPTLDVGSFRDSGPFMGVEGWLPVTEGWTLKALVGWWPRTRHANPFDVDDMHPVYTVGTGIRFSQWTTLNLAGAWNPDADDALVVVGLSYRF